jgi:coenzyme F420-0:L-glutamate ligase/coenzyme F420-1:gamma-L-glutamate ligase
MKTRLKNSMKLYRKSGFSVFGLQGIPSIKEGDDLGKIIVETASNQDLSLEGGDIIVVAQKIVSKSEGRIIDLREITPSPFAKKIAKHARKDPRHIEVILNETKEIVKMQGHHLITETYHGFVCANAGVDKSNIEGTRYISTLPRDSDASARVLRRRIKHLTGADVAVIISDTFGRPWRLGQTNVAIGISGMRPLLDYRGRKDMYGRVLRLTVMAVADELASTGELVMRKSDKTPVALIRGYHYTKGKGSIKEIIRPKGFDLFR